MQSTAPRIVPRNFDVDMRSVPRHWLAENAAATAIANGVNLLFPHGERFFVRSVKYFLDEVSDPELRSAIRGFFGQEGRHAQAHDRFNAIMRAQGFEVDRFLTTYKRLSDWLEAHMTPKLRLAVTAACEHFTAIMAEGAFTEGMLERAAPEMQQLMAWHAAEEIEHKAVAFDVLRQVDPSYALRIFGLLYGTTLLGGFWLWAAISLLRQEKLGLRGIRRELRKLGQRDPIARRVFLRGIRQYLARDFHPSHNATEQLASEWLVAHGMSLPGAMTEVA